MTWICNLAGSRNIYLLPSIRTWTMTESGGKERENMAREDMEDMEDMLTWTMTESGGREREDMAKEVFFTLFRLLGCLGSQRSSSKLMSGVDSFTWVTRLKWRFG